MPIVIPRREVWTRQPQQAVGIDWSNSATKKLIGAFNLSQGFVNSVSGMVFTATLVGGASISAGALRTSNGCAYIGGGADLAPGGAQTILMVNRITAIDDPWGGIFLISDSGGSSNVFGIQLGNGGVYRIYASGSYFDTTVAKATLVSSKSQVIAATIDQSNNGCLYKNGILLSSGSVGSSPPSNSTPRLVFCGERSAATTMQYDGETFLVLLWGRALSSVEIAQISANPWQIFQP